MYTHCPSNSEKVGENLKNKLVLSLMAIYIQRVRVSQSITENPTIVIEFQSHLAFPQAKIQSVDEIL